ncbi:uncharacterized protein PpBr36_10724 [Pyricularia pennisetigena]|uniref:uncharacterized protein n=1 Tax=Pyricularia pennisetigena TaxID=1578925 RepID=UPI00114D5439|nr:uncharacterized protein PpBr36_10724 [Pyricularia pennisetigena]TLS21047.1 hypothetical protein PpBr36_10724 [Pyricularia pennisetigena]
MIPVYLFVGLFALLANCAPPAILFRADKRTPTEIANAGGFISKALTNGYSENDWCTLAEHQSEVTANDPYISTSVNQAASLRFLSLPPKIHSGYLYRIDTQIAQAAGVVFYDCKVTGAHQSEQEFAAFKKIPLEAICLYVEFKNQEPLNKPRPIPPCKPANLKGNACSLGKRGLQRRNCGGTDGAPSNRAQQRKPDAERKKTDPKAATQAKAQVAPKAKTAALAPAQDQGQGRVQGQSASTQKTPAQKQGAQKKGQQDAQLRQVKASRSSATLGATTTNKNNGKGPR